MVDKRIEAGSKVGGHDAPNINNSSYKTKFLEVLEIPEIGEVFMFATSNVSGFQVVGVGCNIKGCTWTAANPANSPSVFNNQNRKEHEENWLARRVFL